MAVLQQGNAVFGREIGASNEEKAGYYRQALVRYQEAASLFPDDPRPFLYEGLCYERLAAIEQSAGEKQQEFVLGEAALGNAMNLRTTSSDYNPSMPFRVLASLYLHMGDYRGTLDALQKARQAGPPDADAATIDRDIQNIQAYLQMNNQKH
jgi:tetratricopeptide (TPR) repeat protein